MNYPLAEAIISYIGGSRLQPEILAQHGELGRTVRADDAAAFGRRLERVLTSYRPETTRAMLNLLDSHDTPRMLTLVGGDRPTAFMSWLAIMTLPGAPCVYYGDEVGLPGEHDPDCRRAFPWDRAAWDEGLLAWLRALIAIRHAEPALRHGDTAVVATDGMGFAYLRYDATTAFVVALNAGEEVTAIDLRLPGRKGVLQPVPLPGESRVGGAAIWDGHATLEMPARTGAVLRVG
jgi:neopullulanase